MKINWEVKMIEKGEYCVLMPSSMHNKRNKKSHQADREMENWATIKTKIVSNIIEQFTNEFVFMRLYTYYEPKILLANSSVCKIQSIVDKRKNEYLFLISECQDFRVVQALFETGTLENGGFAIVSLNYRPDDLQQTAEKYHKIIQDLLYFKTKARLVNELERCNFLCYTVDEFLIIEKVELTEVIILSILNSIASEEGLELVVDRSK